MCGGEEPPESRMPDHHPTTPPPRHLTHFERLGLPRRFSVDASHIEREYLARSRAVHPDFHHLGTAAEQRESLESTAALNEAYLTLKDTFRRAEYLLGLFGGPTAQKEKNLDQAFLMEMMEYRERIEEAKAANGNLDAIEGELVGRLDALNGEVAARFRKLEESPLDTPAARTESTAIRRLLNAAKTLQSLLRDLRFD